MNLKEMVTTLLIPAILYLFTLVFQLEKADAVHENKLEQLIKTTDEVRGDVKKLLNISSKETV